MGVVRFIKKVKERLSGGERTGVERKKFDKNWHGTRNGWGWMELSLLHNYCKPLEKATYDDEVDRLGLMAGVEGFMSASSGRLLSC